LEIVYQTEKCQTICREEQYRKLTSAAVDDHIWDCRCTCNLKYSLSFLLFSWL